MTLVAGVDSSTQSCKVVVCDAESGRVVRQATAPHPDATEVDPRHWWDAWTVASAGLLDEVRAIGVGGQQHGLVALDSAGEVVRPALLWNDTRSAPDAADLVAERGPAEWARAVGSVPLASFTVTKLRWLARNEPDNSRRVENVLLPHDWLTWRLLGRPADPTTDRGDASGTGYWSPHTGQYRTDLLEAAFGRSVQVPRVLAPDQPAGSTADGLIVAAGTGDNMGVALGLGLQAGDVAVSVGTSGVVSAVHSQPSADPTGNVAGFCDATGRFLPLVCTLNGARVLSTVARLLGRDLGEIDDLALAAPIGADGLTLLPYLDGERTPNLPTAAGALCGLRRTNSDPAHLARAAVEGLLCGLADGLDALRSVGVQAREVTMVGGGSQSAAILALAPDILGIPVVRPEPAEYVARGAAKQAAWVLFGDENPPDWPVPVGSAAEPLNVDAGTQVRAQYAGHRQAVFGV
ncbi:MAG TPA: xylulokinase [Jiangellaceae bacterium]|jgi:xylulokinase|nr:xylulokinase [Jiangellaceae bacterium]